MNYSSIFITAKLMNFMIEINSRKNGRVEEKKRKEKKKKERKD